MINTFKNAYFGKAYKTRDGRKAIYCKYEMIYGVVPNSEHSITKHLLLINNMQFVNVFEDGTTVKEKEYPNDIVSEWQEPIDEEKLNKIATESYPYFFSDDIDTWEEAYCAGYRKALEN